MATSLLIAASIVGCGLLVLAVLYVVLADQMAVVTASPDPQGPIDVTLSGGVRSEVLHAVFPTLALLVLGLTVLAGFLGWWLSGRLLRRVHEITQTARSVGAGDLGARLALPGPRDEITELGDTFDEMLDRLQSSFEAQRLFVANASHELRTPLAAGRLALEAPLAQGVFTGPAREAASDGLAGITRAARLLDSLLTLAESRQAPLATAARVDICDLVRAAVDAEAERATYRRLDIRTVLSRSLVLGDPELLRRAVDNLVVNAAIHAPEGTQVEVRCAASGETVSLEIRNDGPELTLEEARELKTAFARGRLNRVAGAGRPPGHGLGLSITEAIALRHGGSLDLRPNDGGGLVARVTLPSHATAAPH